MILLESGDVAKIRALQLPLEGRTGMNLTYIRRWRICRRAFRKIIRNSDDGFTLLEVLAAIALLSIVVTPLLGLITSSLAMHSQREYQTRAAFLAQLRLEEVKQNITGSSDFANADYNKPGVSTTDFGRKTAFMGPIQNSGILSGMIMMPI